MDKNLQEKIIDEHLHFLSSRIWALLKFRFIEYQRRQQEYMTNFIRTENWGAASRLQGMIDGISEIIKLTERLGTDIKEKNLDVDGALHVMEISRAI